MIESFKCDYTKELFSNEECKHWKDIEIVATRKLKMLDSAKKLQDLMKPPGNKLELLSGDRKGQYSIRINEKYRICFNWTEKGCENVEIVDYH